MNCMGLEAVALGEPKRPNCLCIRNIRAIRHHSKQGRFDNSGPGGRWFESTRPDQIIQEDSVYPEIGGGCDVDGDVTVSEPQVVFGRSAVSGARLWPALRKPAFAVLA